MKRALLVGAALCSVGLTASIATADWFNATRSDKLVERAHEVSVTLGRDQAKLIVVRTVYNGASHHDQATFHILLPPTGVATGLRTLARLDGHPHWYDGELMEAEAAAAKYRELTGLGGYYPKDPALLSWRSPGYLALQVFPCPPGERKSVEYTVELPTNYEAGAYRITLPWLGTEQVAARFHVRPASPDDRVEVDGRPLPPSGRISVPRGGEVSLALFPGTQSQLDGELAVVPFAARRVLTRYRFVAARELSAVPDGAHIVAVLDGSASVSDDTQRAGAAAIAAYLGHFSNARVEVLTFDRQVHHRYGGFVGVEQVRADLEQFSPAGANGSALDDALFAADRLLTHAPPGAARRIVAITDGRTRAALSPSRIQAAVAGSGAVVHLGIFDEDEPRLLRDDEHPWAPAIRTTGGLVWKASGTTTTASTGDQQRVYEEWARPVRIDHAKIVSPDLALEAGRGDVTLDEGESLTFTGVVGDKTRWVRLDGELWATPVHHVLVPSTRQGQLWSALVFGTELLDELSESEMMTLAMHGGAVSPVTSYLAIEPGVRPSTEGLWPDEIGEAFGAGGLGLSGVGHGGGGRGLAALDRDAWLQDQLARAWQRCGGMPDSATVDFETTLHEVVSVGSVRQLNPDAILGRCLSEAVWGLALPANFNEEWNVWTVTV